MTHQQVIDALLSTYEPLPFSDSCDGFKFGDPEEICTGIATTCVLTPNVIEKAIDKDCNLIIVHEPSFYTHDDDTDWLKRDEVYIEKTSLMREHGIAVWRNHDHMHSSSPDEIMIGLMRELDWEKYVDNHEYGFRTVIKLPETTLGELSSYLKERLRLRTGRIVGNPDAKVSRVAFCGHIFPSWNEDERQHTLLCAQSDVDVLIPGEIIDWSTASYVRDAAQLGKAKALIQVGHFNMEEPGMRYLADKLSGLLPQMPVSFIPAGDQYFFV